MNGKAIRIVTVVAALYVLVGCEERAAEPDRPNSTLPPHMIALETRTFTLEGVSPMEAANIIDAYVYRDRPHNPGMISADRNMLSVRETADNLDRIGRVIDELNAGATASATETTLHFQLVEANGASETDARIADVEAQLRQVLRFDGYRLLDEAFVTTRQGQIDIPMEAPDGRPYKVSGMFSEGPTRTGSNLNVVDSSLRLTVWFTTRGTELLSSTVNIRHGQTVVLGSARAPGLRAEGNGEEGEYHRGPQMILILRATAATPDDAA